jgi:hypothetical protein
VAPGLLGVLGTVVEFPASSEPKAAIDLAVVEAFVAYAVAPAHEEVGEVSIIFVVPRTVGKAFVVFVNLKSSMLGKVVVVGGMVTVLVSRAVGAFVGFVAFSALGIVVREAFVKFAPVSVLPKALPVSVVMGVPL